MTLPGADGEAMSLGYKQSAIGVIPEEWDIARLSDMLDFRNGANADKASYGRGIRFINVLEVITHSHLTASDVPGRVSLPEPLIRAYEVRHGDLVFNRTSETQEEVGLAAVYVDDESVVFGGFVIRGRFHKCVFDPLYSGYALRAETIRAQIVAKGQGAIRANIGQADLGRVLVAVPPCDQQRAIAAALSDVDHHIAALNALIAKKRAIMQATMQQLLAGTTRLPGFGGEWVSKQLGEVAEIVSGGTPKTNVPEYWGGGIPWCTPTDITSSRSKYLLSTERTISHAGLLASSAQLLPKGALLLCSRATIGELRIATRPICTNQGFKSLVPLTGYDGEFLYYLMSTMKSQLLEKSIGSTFLEISKRDIASLVLSLPSLPEQQAIAQVLSDMDADIEALEARVAKTRDIKQGMMQQLLTGRIRLVTPAEAPEEAMP